MERKSFPAHIKAREGSEGTGSFEALVSVFGNIDSYGDVVEPGAFARTLNERGLPPVFYSHQWSDLPIGMSTRAEETDAGLVITADLFIEESEAARITYKALLVGALREFSFAYETIDSTTETRDGHEVRVLRDLELYEVGPTLVGANDATELLEVRHYRTDRPEPVGLHAIEHREPDPGLLERRARLLLARPRIVFRREGGGYEALGESP